MVLLARCSFGMFWLLPALYLGHIIKMRCPTAERISRPSALFNQFEAVHGGGHSQSHVGTMILRLRIQMDSFANVIIIIMILVCKYMYVSE